MPNRRWQETNLEEWFRQRSVELARRAAKRHFGGNLRHRAPQPG